MEIADRRVATLHFSLTDQEGKQVTDTHGHAPLVHMQGSGGIIPALEDALQGKQAGDRFQVVVEPGRGFGPHHPELVQTLPRAAFKGQQAPTVGARLHAQTSRGPVEVVVTALDDHSIGVDANHPLAGKTFTLDVEVMDVRLATPDELQFGVKPAV